MSALALNGFHPLTESESRYVTGGDTTATATILAFAASGAGIGVRTRTWQGVVAGAVIGGIVGAIVHYW